jgi:hypothetical protein
MHEVRAAQMHEVRAAQMHEVRAAQMHEVRGEHEVPRDEKSKQEKICCSWL